MKLIGSGSVARRTSLRRLALVAMSIAGLIVLTDAARADCQQQLQQLGDDLRGVVLTDTQKQTIGGLVEDARRYCWVHQEAPATHYLAKARQAAGLRPLVDKFDWESVPLESLEKR